ncbi:helix-turn-helix domain-containing protein [Streptomyces oryzae]|uniref:Helix-turn-helix domain-containing protein n=1 Tax=Streptomyces oryzae TaxID=1434886 RepID=A0ABS3X7K9_9ACTN|nr:helix-turn-helix domain-containing protein [Streptomyces oryzae]
MHADQQRSPLGAASGQPPQKATEPPHKCPRAASDSAEGLAAPYFCGTSRAFCGAHPSNHNTPGQQPSSRVSADSAVSAAGVPSSQSARKPRRRSTLANRRATGPTDELLPLTAVLDELGITRATWYRWRNRGWGPRARRLPNGHLRVRRSDLDEFQAELEAA